MMQFISAEEDKKLDVEEARADLGAKLKRMDVLKKEIERVEARIQEEEKLTLDVTIPEWSSPFVVKVYATKFEVELAKGISLTSSPASVFESLKFLTFSRGSSFSGSIRPVPFSRGTFRYAYYARSDSGVRYVMKHMIDVYHMQDDEMLDLKEGAGVHFLGKFVVDEFNRMRPAGCVSFEMLTCEVLEWEKDHRPQELVVSLVKDKDVNFPSTSHLSPISPQPGRPSRQAWCLEPLLDGAFAKFNNNGTYQDPAFPFAHALSHFSYHLFNGTLMMVDIQGCLSKDKSVCMLTDPGFHTSSGIGLGETNLGKRGFQQFFANHKCGDICKALNLTVPTFEDMPPPKDVKASSVPSPSPLQEKGLPVVSSAPAPSPSSSSAASLPKLDATEVSDIDGRRKEAE